jgi:hypothetical protein
VSWYSVVTDRCKYGNCGRMFIVLGELYRQPHSNYLTSLYSVQLYEEIASASEPFFHFVCLLVLHE